MPVTDDFGTELQHRRLAAGLSLRQLSRLVHFDVSHLSRVENGKRRPGRVLARLCDNVLAAGGALETLAAGGPQTADTSEDPPGTYRPVDGAGTIADDPISRHALRLMFHQLRESGQRTASEMVLPAAIAQSRAVSDLAARSGARARRELFELAAHHAEFVGWMLQEQGDSRGALDWTARAVQLDQQADRADMAAYALVRAAELALYRGRPDHVVLLAGRAQQIIGVRPRISALAAQREAQGHAMAGDRARCEAALARSAERWAGRSDSEPENDLFGSSSVPDLHAMVAAWCELDLGRPDDAAERLTTVLATMPGTARRARTLLGARLATAHALRGAPDSSCEVAGHLVADAKVLNSATARLQFRRLSAELRRWPRHHDAIRIRVELNGVLRTGRRSPQATDNG
jgi:transcriptional regulator with XRE-family HTH domain